MLRHLLILRLSLVTMAGIALAIWAHASGYVVPIFAGDISRLSYAIGALFMAGLVSTYARAFKVTLLLDDTKGGAALGYMARRRVRKLSDKAAHISDIAAWLQVLGLLGTVIGFSIALLGLEADEFQTIISGLRTAIGTTILGGFLSLWTSINYRILDTATAGLAEDVRG